MLSINNVPYRDTFRFMREVNEVLDRDFNSVFDMLTEFVSLENEESGYEEFESLPFSEPLRLPRSDWFTDETTLRRLNARWKREKLGYSSKRKEVK